MWPSCIVGYAGGGFWKGQHGFLNCPWVSQTGLLSKCALSAPHAYVMGNDGHVEKRGILCPLYQGATLLIYLLTQSEISALTRWHAYCTICYHGYQMIAHNYIHLIFVSSRKQQMDKTVIQLSYLCKDHNCITTRSCDWSVVCRCKRRTSTASDWNRGAG